MSAHVVRFPAEPRQFCGGQATVVQVPLGQDNLGWMVICEATREAALVDGPDAGAYLSRCEALGVRPTTVWNTHTHGDHVGLNHDLQRRGLLAAMRVFGPAAARDDVPGITDAVDEGDVVSVGRLTARVMRTDGHLNGHISFVIGDAATPGAAVFCGDTLFAAGCGYLFDGPPAAMAQSLRRLAALHPDTAVCCAHEYTWDNLRFAFHVDGDNPALWARILAARATLDAGGSCVPSTIGMERATNPFLRAGDPILKRFAAMQCELSLPDEPDAAFAILRMLKNGPRWRGVSDDEILAEVGRKSAEI